MTFGGGFVISCTGGLVVAGRLGLASVGGGFVATGGG